MHFHLHKVTRAVQFKETQRGKRGARAWGRGSGECLPGTEVQFGKTGEFWGRAAVVFAHSVEVLDATELH